MTLVMVRCPKCSEYVTGEIDDGGANGRVKAHYTMGRGDYVICSGSNKLIETNRDVRRATLGEPS